MSDQEARDEREALVLDAAAAELEARYPRDIWPEPTDAQLIALHKFARSIGLPDGSRFHVGGIRHAAAMLRADAAQMRSNQTTIHTNGDL